MSGLAHSTIAAFAAWSATVAAVVLADAGLSWQAHRVRPRQPAAAVGRGASRARPGALWPWLVLFLAALVWEMLGIDTGRGTPHLTISALAQAFRAVDAALFLVWVLVGLGYGLARARTGAGSLPPPATTGRSETATAVVLGLLLPSSRPAGVAFWIAWLAACFTVELVARRFPHRFVDAEQLLGVLSGRAAARPVLVVVWAYAGWHLFAH